jgi:multicomponent Na+:H+ antiporter subunit B
LTTLLLVAPTVLFGLYMVTHGQVSPGGGFQGGVILSTPPLLVYLASGYPKFRRIVHPHLVEAAEAIGAAAYIIVGGACVILGGLFLQNLLSLGKSGTVTGGGTIAFIDLGVGAEVSGGLVLALLVCLEELMEEKEQ